MINKNATTAEIMTIVIKSVLEDVELDWLIGGEIGIFIGAVKIA